MKASWTGILICAAVIYYGIVHAASNPTILLNAHALILVVGGTIGVSFLTYSSERLAQTMDFVIFGFLFRKQKSEETYAKDLVAYIDIQYSLKPKFELSKKIHPFIKESFQLAENKALNDDELETILQDLRDSMKRRYFEDAKILNNIAKYPPHLGLLGAASGMIEMMSGLGKTGIESIGGSLAIALTATLWGVGLNNFVFLPLADNSTKAAEDEIYLRDIVIQSVLMIRRGASHELVIKSCLSKLDIADRATLAKAYSFNNPNKSIEDKYEQAG